MFACSNDNDNHYPDGKSATEVFQKLLDGGYVSDPTLFYLPMAGKVKPAHDQKKLRPENVSWDVTGGVDSSSSDEVPLVFLTGWKVDYAAGKSPIPLSKPYPQYGWEDPNASFFSWSSIKPLGDGGIAVYYKGNNAAFKKAVTGTNGEVTIPDFFYPDYKPDGHTYRQLTPDGVLP